MPEEKKTGSLTKYVRRTWIDYTRSLKNVILVTRFDSADYRFIKNEVVLSELLRDIFNSIAYTYRNDRIFEEKIDEGLKIQGDRTSLSSMIWNLLENAVKYTSKNDTIEIRLKKEDSWLILKVKDSGNWNSGA